MENELLWDMINQSYDIDYLDDFDSLSFIL